MERMRLARASITTTSYGLNPYGDTNVSDRIVQGLWSGVNGSGTPRDYREELRQCRYFYRYDPIASTVVNRMADMAISDIRNRRVRCNDEEMAYFDAVAKILTPLLEACALEYLVSGMAIPDFTLTRIMGSRLTTALGRTRYVVPATLWVRNPDHILLKRIPGTMKRAVYLQVPTEEIYFIQHNGVFADGTEDFETYLFLEQQYPEYVARVKAGATTIKLNDARPVLRKAMAHCDYPQPFLVPALASLKHKLRIKQMDYSIATRALEAVRLVKAGSDLFPVTEDDPLLDNIKSQIQSQRSVINDEVIYSLFTNHTVTMEWIYPPLDALLSEQKYNEPNAEIFMAMGFSRVLLVGESLRSNSSQSVASTLGPVATLNELRRALLAWVSEFYRELAEANGFKNAPEPVFQPIPMGDVAALIQFAIEAAKTGILSKDTVARMFNSDFESEYQQIEAEASASGVPTIQDLTVQQPLEIQQNQQEHQQEMDTERLQMQKDQQERNNKMQDQQLALQKKQGTQPQQKPTPGQQKSGR